MPPKPDKSQEKIVADLRKLGKLEGNKTCVDCPEKMPGYINLTHKTFVCTKCSGIHRELQFKIKGISMSVFTAEDVTDMSAGGNVAFNTLYLARHPRDHTIPNGSDIVKLKDFIKQKYVEKRWYGGGDSGTNVVPTRSSGNFGVTNGTTSVSNNKPSAFSRQSPAAINSPAARNDSGDASKFDFLDNGKSADLFDGFNGGNGNAPTNSNVPSAQFDAFGHGSNNNMNHGFDAFGTTNPAASFDPFAQSSTTTSNAVSGTTKPEIFSHGSFDAFGGGASKDSFDAFGTSVPSAPSFDTFGDPFSAQTSGVTQSQSNTRPSIPAIQGPPGSNNNQRNTLIPGTTSVGKPSSPSTVAGGSSLFDPFGPPAASAGSNISSNNGFNAPSFDPFGGSSQAHTSDPFGVMSSPQPTQQQQQQQASSFGQPLHSSPPNPSNNNQNDFFGMSSMNSQTSPAPTTVAPPAPKPIPKNFSVFDDLEPPPVPPVYNQMPGYSQGGVPIMPVGSQGTMPGMNYGQMMYGGPIPGQPNGMNPQQQQQYQQQMQFQQQQMMMMQQQQQPGSYGYPPGVGYGQSIPGQMPIAGGQMMAPGQAQGYPGGVMPYGASGYPNQLPHRPQQQAPEAVPDAFSSLGSMAFTAVKSEPSRGRSESNSTNPHSGNSGSFPTSSSSFGQGQGQSAAKDPFNMSQMSASLSSSSMAFSGQSMTTPSSQQMSMPTQMQQQQQTMSYNNNPSMGSVGGMPNFGTAVPSTSQNYSSNMMQPSSVPTPIVPAAAPISVESSNPFDLF